MRGIGFKIITDDYKNTGDYAKLRTGVSRAYYAVFHGILDVWRVGGWDKMFIQECCNNHQKIGSLLRHCKEYSGIVQVVDDLRRLRFDADYKLTNELDTKMSKFIRDASDLIDLYIERFNSYDHAKAAREIQERTVDNGLGPLGYKKQ